MLASRISTNIGTVRDRQCNGAEPYISSDVSPHYGKDQAEFFKSSETTSTLSQMSGSIDCHQTRL